MLGNFRPWGAKTFQLCGLIFVAVALKTVKIAQTQYHPDNLGTVEAAMAVYSCCHINFVVRCQVVKYRGRLSKICRYESPLWSPKIIIIRDQIIYILSDIMIKGASKFQILKFVFISFLQIL